MKIRQWAIAALLAAAGLLGWATTAFAADNAITTAYVNGRSGPGTGYGVVYVVPPDTTVEVISTQNNFCQSNRSGFPTVWISCSYLNALPGGGGGGGAPAPEEPEVNVNFCFTGQLGNQICLGSGGVGVNVNVPAPKRACFYEEPNFAGDDLCVNAGYSDNFWNMPWRTNIRSVRVYGGASVVMCRNANYAGFCRTYTSDRVHIHSQLRDHTYSVSVN